MSKYVSKLSKVGISLFAVFCMMACHTGEIDHNYENMVYVNQNSLNLFFGDTEQLTASPTESTFEWTSEDPSVATVNNEGLVTATGVGNTQIIITQGEWTQTVDVTVSLPTSKEVLARAGNKRVLIEVTIDNEKVQKMNVVCNNNDSSIEEDVNYKSGVFKFYLGEQGLTSLDIFGNARSWMSSEAYQSFGGYREGAAVPQTEHKDTGSSDIYYGDEEPRVINKIVYCHKDGTEVATLWEENQNLPILNSEK